ncbi:MAG: M20/M25/M40 family metallo-hydrolase [Balneolaceae bacterium]|nr:M20/M25/M40 family metallo-hydrolase [Balneolaceae bacterium]MCH8548868.1 M20/M25/M40 family metallo-hydrolase [Balneolaceae bacterium]
MKKFHSLSALLIVLLIITGCRSSVERAERGITGQALLEHIEILASDEFEGRAPATQGEILTIEYLTEQLSQMGVEPGMPDGSYTQEFPLLGQQVDGDQSSFTIRQNGNVVADLSYGPDFMGWPSNEEERIELSNAELIYVGYGIQAPEFDWDDYKDVDVEGKVLVYKNSDPSFDPDIFDGDSRLYYGRWSYKFEIAEEMGALGAIIIHTDETAGYGWSVVENSWGRERFTLPVATGELEGRPEFNSWLTQESSETLFEAAGFDLMEMLDAAADREFRPVTLEGVTLDVELTAEYSDMSSNNVVAKIEGSDPDLMDEYVIFSAHHDHLGITTPVDGDSINNGAWDNASGVSAMLETARAFKEIEGEFKRSVLFLFVGAEEMGLLGSQYWAENPTVHPGKVSANFNLDSMQIFGSTRDLVLVGYNRNTLTDYLREEADRRDRVIVPDPQPEQGFFYRSDHFSFARVGIPAIYPNPGREFFDKPQEWNATVDSLRTAMYHTVHDQVNEYWDMAGMEEDTRLIFRAALNVMNADEMMEWAPGDEFEATRLEMLQDVQ